MTTELFEKYESQVRSYCRSFPTVFTRAKGSLLWDTDGREYIDFFNGAGALNYGHNPDFIKARIADYLASDGIMHALDMYTVPKAHFIDVLENQILIPKGLDYKVQFPGPTGTNAVEAALKLARKVKGRSNVFALMGAFHGMTLGSLSLTTDWGSRAGAGVALHDVTHVPAPYQYGDEFALNYIEMLLTDDHSATSKPAAIIIETVQAEGGVYVFSNEYLQGLRRICDEHGVLLVVDDIQIGCGRTGTFFSFERSGVVPDIVTLSKSIGGYGMPFALTLFKPELDVWSPGEHNGTFRGNQLAIVAATGGLELSLAEDVPGGAARRGEVIGTYLREQVAPLLNRIPQADVRGIGCIWGVDVRSGETAAAITRECFENGVIMERAGRDNGVVKLMPSLLIPDEELLAGLKVLRDATAKVLA
ncbi:MAG: aspartate aminotransferase family protein [Propionibacteriaceae bacterium]|jgi:diaminobutyrate-2-oxoglutarate transaminase|nr:aspartate aminotransferase family protein [Propionibacteriaceae bacterium]